MKKVILATFKEDSVAYEAFSKVSNMGDATNLKINQLAVIQKTPKGYDVKDSLDNQTESRMFNGGVIGAVIGIMGGPLGILCGWIVGDLAGIGTSYLKNKRTNTIFDSISNVLIDGETALLMYVDEDDPSYLDITLSDKLGANLIRFNYDDVETDIKDADKNS